MIVDMKIKAVLIKKKLYKYYEFFTTKIMILFKQKTFSFNGVKLKYILEKSKSNDLTVVFSSCTRVGVKARYNYMRTLSSVKSNKLFILDNFSPDGRGSWYLGRNGTFCEEKATEELIAKVHSETGKGKILFCGSSKGGYAALDFGVLFENASIIIGAPQFYLGYYLRAPESEERVRYILGDNFKNEMDILDNHLAERIKKSEHKNSSKIYIHFSDREHTYFEHVRDLVQLLEENGYNLSRDIADYRNHSDISFFFPEFLKSTILDVLSRKHGKELCRDREV